jgi:hypothetical protein
VTPPPTRSSCCLANAGIGGQVVSASAFVCPTIPYFDHSSSESAQARVVGYHDEFAINPVVHDL